jgi:ABC-type Zn uptake system ZnuABC Zn-binding protein ZnuA
VINTFYEPPVRCETDLVASVVVWTHTSVIVIVETDVSEVASGSESRKIEVIVTTTGTSKVDAVESVTQIVLVVTSTSDVYSVESLTAATVLSVIRHNMWQRTKTGLILMGDPPRRSSVAA